MEECGSFSTTYVGESGEGEWKEKEEEEIGTVVGWRYACAVERDLSYFVES
jgi:hypothetical protein